MPAQLPDEKVGGIDIIFGKVKKRQASHWLCGLFAYSLHSLGWDTYAVFVVCKLNFKERPNMIFNPAGVGAALYIYPGCSPMAIHI